MSNIFISFVLFSITLFVANGELSEETKKNIKFVCGEVVISGGRSGHLDGPGKPETAYLTYFYKKVPIPKNFTLKKPIKKEDNLTIKYSVLCGSKLHEFPLKPHICDILDSQSDDEKTNLYKTFLDLLGFNVSSSCPIPAGNYKLKQQNDYNPLLSDFFGSKCSETNKFFGNYGCIEVDIIDENFPIMASAWHQVKLDGKDNCTELGSVIKKSVASTISLPKMMLRSSKKKKNK